MSYREKIVKMLFETTAFRVAESENPFWYTSGALGPLYINTHFLYGSEEKANLLLEVIDRNKNNYTKCPFIVLNLIRKNYKEDEIYKNLINIVLKYINDNIDLNTVDYISGGERRDWFFSLIIADFLKKKHITLYKDGTSVITYNDKLLDEDISGKKVFHIADLMNIASSYIDVWIPSIKERGAEITKSLVIIDRKQGGDERVIKENIEPHSIIDINKNFIIYLKTLGMIDKIQSDVLINYMNNPKRTMQDFLNENPEFIKNSLESEDKKTRARAKKCLDNNIYKI